LIRVINNRREEIDRLNQSQVIPNPKNTGIVSFVEPDKQIRMI
jgi:hypothetical protein